MGQYEVAGAAGQQLEQAGDERHRLQQAGVDPGDDAGRLGLLDHREPTNPVTASRPTVVGVGSEWSRYQQLVEGGGPARIRDVTAKGGSPSSVKPPRRRSIWCSR